MSTILALQPIGQWDSLNDMNFLYISAVLLLFCIMASVVFALFEYKYSPKKTAVLVCVYCVVMPLINVALLIASLGNVIIYYQLTLFSFALITVGMCFLISNWSWSKTLFTALVGISFSAMILQIGYLISEMTSNFSVSRLVIVTVAITLSLAISYVIITKIKVIFTEAINSLPKNYGWYSLIAVAQILVHTLYFNSAIEKTWRHYLVVISINVVVIISYKLLFFSIQKVKAEEQDKMHNKMYQTQVRMMQDQVQATRESENIMRIARHDMKHYGGVIKTLLQSGDIDKAIEYLDFVRTSADASITKVYSKNPIINACLVYYDKKARREDISVDLNISVPESSDSKDMEFVAVLSNAFENAINASLKEEDITKRKIDIYVDKNEDRLLLEVKNNYVGEVVFNREGMPQTKNGVGIISIKEFVKKYGADLRFQTVGDTFILQMILIVT